MSEDIRKMIDKVKNFKQFVNEQQNVETNLNNNFWKWFDSSKVVENGKPLLLYHFSDNKFNIFDKKDGFNTNLFSTEKVKRNGIFFSPNEMFSSKFGKEKYGVYLKIKNIFDFKEHYYYNGVMVKTSDFFDDVIEFIENNGIDLSMEYQSYTGELKIKPEYNWKWFDGEIGKYFVDFLKTNDYDGVYFFEEENIPAYVVFNSTQIKSVENDGTWDIGDDNIFS